MNSRRYSNLIRKAATVAAIFLLLGQTIAAAHFHWTLAHHELSSRDTATVADSLCPICAAHLNNSATAPTVPALDGPTIADQLAPRALHSAPHSTFVRNCFGRAPPPSV